jgi:hypothetical protein
MRCCHHSACSFFACSGHLSSASRGISHSSHFRLRTALRRSRSGSSFAWNFSQMTSISALFAIDLRVMWGTRLRCRAMGPALDHHRYLSRGTSARPSSDHGRTLPVLPSRRQHRRPDQGSRSHALDPLRSTHAWQHPPGFRLRAVVPEPHVGSRTRSPGSVAIWMQRWIIRAFVCTT